MNAIDAKALLGRIRMHKQADPEKPAVPGPAPLAFSGPLDWLGRTAVSLVNGPEPSQLILDVRAAERRKLQATAMKEIATVLVGAVGLGAAARGVHHAFGPEPVSLERAPTRTAVDMPLMYHSPQAKKRRLKAAFSDANATSPYGLSYYIPSLMLGAPLAAYGGWKGIDALLARTEEAEDETELAKVKRKYEQALLGAYKQATEQALDQAFQTYTKQADWWNPLTWSNNAPGMLTGTTLAYSLATAPLGYLIVNELMQKNSKRKLLEKALQERARRQALLQPEPLYAVPRLSPE